MTTIFRVGLERWTRRVGKVAATHFMNAYKFLATGFFESWLVFIPLEAAGLKTHLALFWALAALAAFGFVGLMFGWWWQLHLYSGTATEAMGFRVNWFG